MSKIKPLFSNHSPPDDPHLLTPVEFAAWDRFQLERRVRAMSTSAYLGKGTAICRVLGRYKMFVETSDVGFASHLLLDGIWEPWITQFLARSIRPGMTVVDIGANFGYYTLLAADIVGDAGRVLAVEPNPAACTLLRRSLAVNGFAARVELLEAAAGARDAAEATLFVPVSEPKNGRLVASPPAEAGAVSIVATKRMDDVLKGLKPVDLIKIDVEGAEEAVLAGLAQTLGRRKPLVVLEFNAARCRAPRETLEKLRSVYPAIAVLRPDGAEAAADDAQILRPDHRDDLILILRT